MGRRTTPSLVRSVLDPTFPSDVNLDPFIDAATVLVDLIEQKPVVGSLTNQHLEVVERWLAAHYADVTHKSTRTSESIGAASRSWSLPSVSPGFEGTIYGQQAINLDTTGTLKSLMGDPVRFTWLGPEETD